MTYTEHYYHRQIEMAIATKPDDLDLDDINPFAGNNSYLAEKIWNDILERHGYVKHSYKGKETKCDVSTAERQAIISYIRSHQLIYAQFAAMCDLSRMTIGNLVRGRQVSKYTMDRVRVVMVRVKDDN